MDFLSDHRDPLEPFLIPVQFNKKDNKDINEIYSLWKNSNADIKGLFQYNRLLNLKDLKSEQTSLKFHDYSYEEKLEELLNNIGITKENISNLFKNADGIVEQKNNKKEKIKLSQICRDWENIKIALKNINYDFYQYVLLKESSLEINLKNQFVLKSFLFNQLCDTYFNVIFILDNISRENIYQKSNELKSSDQYLIDIFEILSSIYIDYILYKGYKLLKTSSVEIIKENLEVKKRLNCSDFYKEKVLKPYFDKNQITAVFASDDAYAPYCGVAVSSIIKNANKEDFYEIVILSNKISEDHQKKFKILETNNCKITFLDISYYLSKLNKFALNLSFTINTYLRFFIPYIFRFFDKILYLDVDLIVNKDISLLYRTNIDQNWFGAITDFGVYRLDVITEKKDFEKKDKCYFLNTLKIKDLKLYFNAGVILWNIKQCKKDKVLRKIINKTKELTETLYPDQDILNAITNGKHIYWLPNYWNVQLNIVIDNRKTKQFPPYIEHLLKNNYIIHFAGPSKPWKDLENINSIYFWQYAIDTNFYLEILYNLFDLKNYSTKKYLIKQITNDFIKKKILKYKLLNIFTFGLIKSFKKRYKKFVSLKKTL